MHRLIYKSRSSGSISKENLRDILYTSLEKNREDEVNGALIATSSHFLQFLEGDFDEVNATFFRIVGDPRHKDIKLVSFHQVDIPLFNEWRMKGFGIFDLNLELENRLKQKYGEEQGSVFLPTAEDEAIDLLYDMEIIKKRT
jgi:hypothetical protein